MSDVTHRMPVFLLAGGLGTRMAGLYHDIPKCLIPVEGKPFLHYVLTNIQRYGFRRVVLLVGHQAQPIMEYAGDGSLFGLNIHYVEDGKTLLGTGGAIKKALSHAEEDFLVTYADSYLDYDWSAIVETYYRRKSQSMVSVYENKDATDKSNIIYRDGKVLSYCKNNPSPAHTYIDWGVSIFAKQTLVSYPDGTWDISNYLQDRIASDALDGCVVPTKYFEIGTPHALEALRQHLHTEREQRHA